MKQNLKGIILIFAAVYLVSCKADSLPNDLVFDSAKWKGADSRTRGRMAHDLQRRSILNDKTKAETAELLGKPDGADNPNRWLYEVDFGGSGAALMSKIYLNVSFDEKTEKTTGAIFTGGQLFGIFTIMPLAAKILSETIK